MLNFVVAIPFVSINKYTVASYPGSFLHMKRGNESGVRLSTQIFLLYHILTEALYS